ncbi:MAG: serine/threonine protein kinase [Rhodothermaceae bacterium]|nr:serine/threonine protein kinase [Rhodothermaceae bacterium]
MATDSLDRLERLFRAARMHPREERAAFLDAACADDPTLRAEVEELLAADAEADDGAFLDTPPTGILDEAVATAARTADPMMERQVGPYRILRSLGEGGMGTVYLAVREEPFQQYVALKIVRAGLGSPDVLRRFEQERQILASLGHPGIARLLDGNVTDDGLPYFAMEYVEGRPLTAYADEHRLPIEERMRLFRDACDAVHYAHQNLILHRDLKPSNILVTPKGTVKLLDFGIAKLLNPHLSPSALPVTRTALRVMTPEYASPEQVRGEPLSTASDVYALGVILYELLTGHRPYRLTRGTTDEMMRVVCEMDPERPSTKVIRDETITRHDGTTETITPAAVGEARDASPERLRRRLKGDLDNIVLMALRKEPQRRYASAEALSEDVGRYLDGHPVAAHRDSRHYRLAKLVRRHPIETTALVALAIMLLGFALFSETQNRRVERERDRAQLERDKAEQVSAFLVTLFEQADPTVTPGDTLTLREVLTDGAARVETELAEQPEVQAAILSVIGQAYRNLGRNVEAEPLLERAVALRREALGDHPDTAESLFALASLYEVSHESARAEPVYQEYLALARQLYGEESIHVLVTLYRLGTLAHVEGRTEEADSLLGEWQRRLEAMPDTTSPDLALSLGNLTDLLFTQGRSEEAEPFIRRAIEIDRQLYGDRHPAVGEDLNRLAIILNNTNRPTEAEPVAREALDLNRALYPDGHIELGNSLQQLGEALQNQGRYDEAEPYFQEDLELRRVLHPEGHHTRARSHTLLARLNYDRGDYVASERYLREAIGIFTDLFGETFLPTIQHRLELTDALREQGRFAEAERTLLTDLDYLTAERGLTDRTRQACLRRLVRLYEAWGRPDAAVQYQAQLDEAGAS